MFPEPEDLVALPGKAVSVLQVPLMVPQLSGLPPKLSYFQFSSVPEAVELWQQRDHQSMCSLAEWQCLTRFECCPALN